MKFRTRDVDGEQVVSVSESDVDAAMRLGNGSYEIRSANVTARASSAMRKALTWAHHNIGRAEVLGRIVGGEVIPAVEPGDGAWWWGTAMPICPGGGGEAVAHG